jgi:hypothetical protein
MVVGTQQLGGSRILDRGADLRARTLTQFGWILYSATGRYTNIQADTSPSAHFAS